MSRSLSIDRSFESGHNGAGPSPPWEKEDIAQVPYVDSTSPSLSNAERDALPSLWAARSNTVVHTRPRVDTSPKQARIATFGSRTSSEDQSNPWGVRTPLTAPPPPIPYETPIYVSGSRSAVEPPTFVKSLPTPPDSETWSSRTTSSTTSPQVKQAATALPGTMSSRGAVRKTPTRHRDTSSTREPRKPKSRMRRWKSVFKEMFTHAPIDESQFVRIEDRHWTDEY